MGILYLITKQLSRDTVTTCRKIIWTTNAAEIFTTEIYDIGEWDAIVGEDPC